MPFTVITLTSVPNSLRGELTKWMQEIAVGVYVGNFSSRVREQLWQHVCDNVKTGEATISYAARNEIGYIFDSFQTKQEVFELDGIPVVRYPVRQKKVEYEEKHGFSRAFQAHMQYKMENRGKKEKSTQGSPVEDSSIESKPVKDSSIESSLAEDGSIESSPVKSSSMESSPMESSPMESSPVKSSSIKSSPMESSPMESSPVKSSSMKSSPMESSLMQSISMPVYVLIDVETTGLDEEKNRIIEIGALKVSGTHVEEFHELLWIDEEVPEFITELTGITKQKLNEEGKDRKEIMEAFSGFIEDVPLVGYNVKFDIKFLMREFERLGLEWKRRGHVDILSLVRQDKMFLENYKFANVMASYGIEMVVQHRALEDVRLLAQLLPKLNGFEKELRKKS